MKLSVRHVFKVCRIGQSTFECRYLLRKENEYICGKFENKENKRFLGDWCKGKAGSVLFEDVEYQAEKYRGRIPPVRICIEGKSSEEVMEEIASIMSDHRPIDEEDIKEETAFTVEYYSEKYSTPMTLIIIPDKISFLLIGATEEYIYSLEDFAPIELH